MKKLMRMLLSALLLLSLVACGGEDKKENSGDTAAAERGAELAGEMGLADSGWIAADSETSPYGKYRSAEEWEAIFSGEADYNNVPAPVQVAPPEPVAIEGVEGGYAGSARTVTFDEADLGESTDVEVWDWKAEMSPEELAEYEEFENTDWEAMMAEMEAEMSGMEGMENMGDISDMPDIDMDDVQQQIDDAMEQAREELENMELPPGYEQYLPGGLDIGALLGGM